MERNAEIVTGEKTYCEKFRLRVGDYDCTDRLYLRAILDLCQDAAGKHADLLHVGYDEMIAENKIWMVLKTRGEILKYPPFSSVVTVKTWPIEPGRVDMDRDYLLLSEDEKEVYAKVSSKWVVCSSLTRRLLRAKEARFDLDGFLPERVFDKPWSKLETPDSFDGETIVTTTVLDLDHNGHINNAKYCDFIYLAVPPLQGKEISRFQIDYVSELKANQKVIVRYKKEENLFKIWGFCEESKSFLAFIEIR